jgi:hypothetical protein
MTMDPIEEQLKNALCREEPRTGFADRVMARIAAQGNSRRGWHTFPQFKWGLALVLLGCIVAGVVYRQVEHQQRTHAQLARQQAVMALRLAGTKIQLAESKVRHLSE